MTQFIRGWIQVKMTNGAHYIVGLHYNAFRFFNKVVTCSLVCVKSEELSII
jgi:hypothetical protein